MYYLKRSSQHKRSGDGSLMLDIDSGAKCCSALPHRADVLKMMALTDGLSLSREE
jgi:hypothetical protein